MKSAALVVTAVLALATPAAAQQTTRDAGGRTVGTATKSGDVTVYRDAGGPPVGTASQR